MRSFSHVPHCAALLGLLLATSGCAVLGGNVKGNFSCRAPEGDCAPTSVIDGRATETVGEKADDLLAQRPGDAAPTSGSLKIVLAAYRDARVVEVPLPEPGGAHFQNPASRREVARALAQAVTTAREPQGEAPPPATDTPDHTNFVLPDVLTAPLQHAPAGGPGTASLPPRVPHPIEGQGEPAPQEGNIP